MPNLVKPSLPPQSSQWGRSVEQRLDRADLARRNLSTLVSGIRATLSSLMSTVGFLKDQTLVAETVPGSYSQISATMDSTADQVYSLATFNPQWDAVLEFTTSSTGKIMYQAGSAIISYSNNYAHTESSIAVEIFPGNTDFSPGNRVFYAGFAGNLVIAKSAWAQIGMAGMGHHHFKTLAPNTLYTARTRRISRIGYDEGVGGTQQGISYWQGTSLVITKIGK